MAQRRLKIFFDGGCRPNPGRMEVAVVVRGAVQLFDDLGSGSNEDAEWLALIRALELAQRLGLTNFELIGDAAEVIRKANAALAQGRDVHGHAAHVRALAGKSPPARIRWIRRAQNLAGIALAARHPR
jgi:ribonuclease HI